MGFNITVWFTLDDTVNGKWVVVSIRSSNTPGCHIWDWLNIQMVRMHEIGLTHYSQM